MNKPHVILKDVERGRRFFKNTFERLNNADFKVINQEIACVLRLMEGKTAKNIARELDISFRTVQAHLVNLKRKMNCLNNVHLVARFIFFLFGE